MSPSLKPGERKILQALATGNRLFKDLRQQCVKNPTILSSYLKNLQKHGLIIRDIDTRKFKLMGHGWEALYLADIRDVITEFGFKKANIKLIGLDIIVSENTDMLKSADDLLGEAGARGVFSAFSRINQFLFQAWRKQVLAFFSEKDKQIIEEYELAFQEAILLIIPPEKRTSKDSAEAIAEKELKRRYPGIEITAAMIKLEAEIIFKKLTENEARAMILEIGSTKKLQERLQSSSHLIDEDKVRLKPLMKCLQSARKINLYKRFLKSLRACPKTLIIFSSLAFYGYLKKQWQLFPEEEETFKAKHPWLYSQI